MSARILVVDDDRVLLGMLGLALHRGGYEAIAAENGEEALEKVQTEQPDLVILDVMLPGISGMDVCKRLRSNPETMALPIIMLSARVQVPDKIRGLEAGADEYVTKPVDIHEMLARIAALLERTQRLREAQPLKHAIVFGFIGAKGGVGTTTVALNVAAALARQEGSVIAVEFRPHYGTFSLQMKQAPVANLGTLLELDPERLSERDLSMSLIKSPSGFRILFGPQNPDEFKEIGPAHAEAVINGLVGLADFIVIDLPCHPSAANQIAVHRCDYVVLVVEREPSCVVSGKITLELLRQWGVSGGLVGAVVVGRTVSPVPMSLEDIASELDCEVIGTIPPAAGEFIAAQKQGMPLVLRQPDHIAVVGLTEVVSKLLDATR